MLRVVTLDTAHLGMSTGEFSHFIFLRNMTGGTTFRQFSNIRETGNRSMRVGMASKTIWETGTMGLIMASHTLRHHLRPFFPRLVGMKTFMTLTAINLVLAAIGFNIIEN
jgi:hypothetical protein